MFNKGYTKGKRRLSAEELMLLNWGAGEDLRVLESPLDSKELKPVHPKGNQPWIFIGRTDAEAEGPILWPPDEQSWLTWKDPNAGKDWRQEEGTTEDEIVGWHHWLDGHEFEQASGLVMDREAWCATAHGAAKSWTWLSEPNWEREGIFQSKCRSEKTKKTLHLPKFIRVVEYINTSQVKQRMICPPVSEHAYARQWSQFSAIWQLILKFLVKHTTSTGPCTGHSLIWFPKLNFTLWLEADLWTFT